MVSRALDLSQVQQINEDTLQILLEENNPSYTQARELYNHLVNTTVNSLKNQGLVKNKESFIILLLEKILRNTEILVDKNLTIESELYRLQTEVLRLTSNGLEPIITAGNRVTGELQKFEVGFRDWNLKFENFSKIFEIWDSGFKTLEQKLEQLGTQITTYSDHYTNTIKGLDSDINQIKTLIIQWKGEFTSINDTIQQLDENYTNNKITVQQAEEKHKSLTNRLINISHRLDLIGANLKSFIEKPSNLFIPSSSSTTSVITTTNKKNFKILPSNNHNFKYT